MTMKLSLAAAAVMALASPALAQTTPTPAIDCTAPQNAALGPCSTNLANPAVNLGAIGPVALPVVAGIAAVAVLVGGGGGSDGTPSTTSTTSTTD